MIKHFLSKKRLDEKRDDSRIKRLQKAGGTALAITAGAVFFSHSDYSKRFHNTVEALSPIARNIKKDMYRNTKNIRDLGTWKRTIEKHAGYNGSEVKKALDNIKNNSKKELDFSINNTKLFSS